MGVEDRFQRCCGEKKKSVRESGVDCSRVMVLNSVAHIPLHTIRPLEAWQTDHGLGVKVTSNF